MAKPTIIETPRPDLAEKRVLRAKYVAEEMAEREAKKDREQLKVEAVVLKKPEAKKILDQITLAFKENIWLIEIIKPQVAAGDLATAWESIKNKITFTAEDKEVFLGLPHRALLRWLEEKENAVRQELEEMYK